MLPDSFDIFETSFLLDCSGQLVAFDSWNRRRAEDAKYFTLSHARTAPPEVRNFLALSGFAFVLKRGTIILPEEISEDGIDEDSPQVKDTIADMGDAIATHQAHLEKQGGSYKVDFDGQLLKCTINDIDSESPNSLIYKMLPIARYFEAPIEMTYKGTVIKINPSAEEYYVIELLKNGGVPNSECAKFEAIINELVAVLPALLQKPKTLDTYLEIAQWFEEYGYALQDSRHPTLNGQRKQVVDLCTQHGYNDSAFYGYAYHFSLLRQAQKTLPPKELHILASINTFVEEVSKNKALYTIARYDGDGEGSDISNVKIECLEEISCLERLATVTDTTPFKTRRPIPWVPAIVKEDGMDIPMLQIIAEARMESVRRRSAIALHHPMLYKALIITPFADFVEIYKAAVTGERAKEDALERKVSNKLAAATQTDLLEELFETEFTTPAQLVYWADCFATCAYNNDQMHDSTTNKLMILGGYDEEQIALRIRGAAHKVGIQLYQLSIETADSWQTKYLTLTIGSASYAAHILSSIVSCLEDKYSKAQHGEISYLAHNGYIEGERFRVPYVTQQSGCLKDYYKLLRHEQLSEQIGRLK